MSVPVTSIQKLNMKEVLYLPNIVTLSRLILLPFIFFCLWRDTLVSNLVAVFLILLAILFDALDGYIAHRRNQVTNVGRILDPLVDKLSVGSGIIFLMVLRDFPLWAAFIIFSRDFIILLLAFLLITKRELITSSNFLGKTTVTALAAMILFYVVDLQPHAALSTYIAVFFVLLSGLDYFVSYLRIVRTSREVQTK